MGFRRRLVLFLIATLIGVQALTLISAYGVVRQNLIEHGRADLAAASAAFMRQLNLLSDRVSDGVQVMALDFPLRQAIAENNRETIFSALKNHGGRIGASRMFLVGLDGRIDADTLRPEMVGSAFPFSDLVADASRNTRGMGLAALDGQIYWIVTVPVNAPVPIAYIAAGVPINDALVENLRQLSVLPATIALALQRPDGVYALAAQTAGRGAGLPVPTERGTPFGETTLVTTAGSESLMLATKLPAARNSPAIVAVFDYPLEEALQPFYDIALPVSMALVIGLGIAMLGAALIARGVSRPIEALAATARRIAAGDYSAPGAIQQSDEIGQLSVAINGMVQAIADRQTRLETAATALEVARDDAVRANAAKSQFLANMSHELRTPLNAVIGFGDMIHGQLLGPICNERYIEYARDIRDSGAHLLSLVEEILDLAKVEAGTLQLARASVAPGEILKCALPILSAMAEKGSVRLQIADDFMSWPAVDADQMKLKQVFINLISNAIKFTPVEGRVSVSAAASDGVLAMRIADSGIGMRAEDVTLVVQPFYRATSALNSKYQGAGLGLPLTKAIVELHGGRLSIESTLGQGTTVTVVLPLAGSAAVRAAKDAA